MDGLFKECAGGAAGHLRSARFRFTTACLAILTLLLIAGTAAAQSRVTSGLVAYYPFTEGSGTTVADQSGVGTPMNLQLSGSVTWLGGQPGVSLNGGRVGTSAAASKVISALRASGHSTFEIWVLPANLTQSGPAALISVGKDATYHDFLLGQAQNANYQVRLLHTTKSAIGWPWLTTTGGSVAVALQHVVHTYDGAVERLYVDGVQRPETLARSGNYTNWDTTAPFSIGNEVTLDKRFRGQVYLVAVYSRALSAAEVQQNYAAGPTGSTETNAPPVANAGADTSVTLPDTLTLAGSVTDDGLPNPPGTVTVSWSKVSGPGTVTFGNASSLTSTAAFSTAGSYTLRLTANDSALSDTDDVSISVQTSGSTNHAPVLAAIGNQSIFAGETRTLALSATDVDGDSLVFSATNLPSFATLTDHGNRTASLYLAPGSGNVGQHTFTVTVTDSGAGPLSDSETLTVTVAAVVAPQRSFADATTSAGVAGPSHFGGHGVQFADVDGNGLPDFYVTMNLQPTDMADLFYHNQGNGTFLEQAAARGIANFDTGSHGGVWADFDNDGDYDLFNGSFDQNRIYRNDGTGHFTDMTTSSGLPVQSLGTRGVIAFDWDRDGDLDILAINGYLGTNDPAGEVNEVYRNNGNWTFTSLTGGALQTAPAGQGAVAVDFDNDGDMDVFAGNRTGPVNVLRNNGAGVFSLVDPSTIGLTQQARDGITFADVNNDGWLDALLNKHLFLGGTGGIFTFSQTFESATGHYMGGFADVDNDGDYDLAFPGRNYVYLNNGSGVFTQGTTFTLGTVNDPRCVAFADVDQDGDLDFFYAQKATYNLLVRNGLAGSNRWLKVQLTGANGQAGAFGARVTVYQAGHLNDPARRITWREATSAYGYLAQDDPVLHLGVGSRYLVDLRVDFPNGATRTFAGVPTNTVVQVSP